MVDAWALRGEEGRGKLRKAAGRRKQPSIRGYPNGATPPQGDPVQTGGELRELKHLSTGRRRNQLGIPQVAASERGEAQTLNVSAIRGL